MDLVYGSLYCFACKDCVYDLDFERISHKLQDKSSKFARNSSGSRYLPWEPDLTEREILKQNPRRKRITENSFIGKQDCANLPSK
jgi:ubiquitin carboxyl-terminal hydrolase 22/27/51